LNLFVNFSKKNQLAYFKKPAPLLKNVFHSFGFKLESSKRLVPWSGSWTNSNKKIWAQVLKGQKTLTLNPSFEHWIPKPSKYTQWLHQLLNSFQLELHPLNYWRGFHCIPKRVTVLVYRGCWIVFHISVYKRSYDQWRLWIWCSVSVNFV
jgi:hypothetical protein